jgi:hypothetical protein
LLELLHELCVAAGEPVTDEATRQYLQALPTSGKTGKVVKSLLSLALDEPRSSEFRLALTAQAAAGRIQRLQRWLARTKS